jgi:ABC-type uncharacterized transport system substrate-binding protein
MVQRHTDMVDKILHRANSADIRVGETTKFELVVNLRTEKALRPTICQPFLPSQIR